jgi:hypothetical protein
VCGGCSLQISIHRGFFAKVTAAGAVAKAAWARRAGRGDTRPGRRGGALR